MKSCGLFYFVVDVRDHTGQMKLFAGKRRDDF
jgi:hypothetical protein